MDDNNTVGRLTSWLRLNPEEEGLCVVEHPIISPLFLCEMYKVEPTLKAVVGARSTWNVATKAYQARPKLNAHFAINAVIRIMRINEDETREFGTGWIASPPIKNRDGYFFYLVTAAHLVSKKNAKDSYPAELRGCFGLSSGGDFYSSRGFEVKKRRLYVDEDADLAVICFNVTEEQLMRAIPDAVSFLLPASPEKYAGAGFGAFGYPGIDSFREACDKDEVAEEQNQKIWQRYGSLFCNKQTCYTAMNYLTSGLQAGGMCCSPSTLVRSVGTCGYFKSASLPGCGGSPLLSNTSEAEGYACYTLLGREGEGKNAVNRATSHDHPGFAAFYGSDILPYIPAEVGRSRAPFDEWCRKHGLGSSKNEETALCSSKSRYFLWD